MVVFTGGDRQTATGEDTIYGTSEYGDQESIYGGRTIGLVDVENCATTSNITCSFSSSFTIYEDAIQMLQQEKVSLITL